MKTTERIQAMFTADVLGKDGLKCPYCDQVYVHFQPPQHYPAGQYEADAIYDIGVRGDVIVLPFSCESGHSWVVVLGFHKGNVFTKIILTGDTSAQHPQE